MSRVPLLTKGYLNGLVLISLLCVSLNGRAESITPLPQSDLSPVNDPEITVTSEGVRIHVKERLLGQVLQRIQNESGIQFQLSKALMDIRITATVEAPDWAMAIHKLLGRYNKAEVWDKDKRLHRVLVLGSGGEGDLRPINATYVPKVVDGAPQGPGREYDDPGTADGPPVRSQSTEFFGPPVRDEQPLGSGPPVWEKLPLGSGPPPDWAQPHESGPVGSTEPMPGPAG